MVPQEGPQRELVVAEPDPRWAGEFSALAKELRSQLGAHLHVEHVGSTAVPDLPAKPVLDVDIVVLDRAAMQALLLPLERLGYVFRGDLGIRHRYAFRRIHTRVPHTDPPREWMAHNLYVCLEGSLGLRNHRCVREALRVQPALRDEYARLKRSLAERFAGRPYDEVIEAYVAAKTPFLVELLSAVLDERERAQVLAANLPQLADLHVRAETPADIAGIHAVNEAAFASAREAELVERLRRACPELVSLVAEQDGEIVGHIAFSPVRLARAGAPSFGMGLGPMAVRPDHQNRGIGTRLVGEGLRRIDAQGCPYVVVLGHPDYYPRFGFQPAAPRGVRCRWPVPDDVLMLRVGDLAAIEGGGDLSHRPEFDDEA
jgi:putative acetyltransferase